MKSALSQAKAREERTNSDDHDALAAVNGRGGVARGIRQELCVEAHGGLSTGRVDSDDDRFERRRRTSSTDGSRIAEKGWTNDQDHQRPFESASFRQQER